MWDEWARSRDGVECCDLEAGKSKTELPDTQQELSFTTVDPKFMLTNIHSAEPRFANKVEIRTYGDRELVAEVIPECDNTMTSARNQVWWNFCARMAICKEIHCVSISLSRLVSEFTSASCGESYFSMAENEERGNDSFSCGINSKTNAFST